MYQDMDKIARIADEIKSYIYTSMEQIEDIEFRLGEVVDVELEGNHPEYKPYLKNTMWGERGEICTFRFQVTVPEQLDGKPVVVLLDSYLYGGANLQNPQYLVYINGSIKQGLDINHREILLSECAKAGTTYEIILEGWPGCLHRKCVLSVSAGTIRRDIEELYFNLEVGYETLMVMDSNDSRYAGMTRAMLETINILDLRNPYSSLFNKSISEANEFIRANLYEKFPNDGVCVWAIGHTHIDVAWLWQIRHTRMKTARSFSTVLDYMEQYPQYLFSSSQPQLFKFLKEDYPEVYEQVKARVKEGRFEAEGGMWLEADCNLISGESMVRQLMDGKQFLLSEFGVDSVVLWLPDVFGYSAAMPQILKKAGVDYFITSKISWNDTNRMPNDTFLWEGIDGTEILSYFHTAPGFGQAEDMFKATYNADMRPEVVLRAWEKYQNKAINNVVMMSYGWGDGGGGPTKEQIEYAKRLENGLGTVPKVHLGGMRGFIQRVEENVQKNARLPKWVGELYLEFHRGTYTSMARNKKYNRNCEMLLRSLEYLYLIKDELLETEDYPQGALHDAWETVLLNQFHDIIPGSSIKEVYDDSKAQYDALIGILSKRLEQVVSELSGKVKLVEDAVIVFNDSGKLREDVLITTLPEGVMAVIDDDGQFYPVQKLADGSSIFYAAGVPAFGYKTFYFSDTIEEQRTVPQTERLVDTPFFTVRFDENMEITSLYDKQNNREVVTEGERFNKLIAFEDKPPYFDAWELSPYYRDKPYPVTGVVSAKVTENGPVCVVVEIVRNYMDSLIRQEIWFYHNIDRIDFKTHIDWRETQTHLCAQFPADIHNDKAVFEIQYGNLERPTHSNTSWDAAKFEVCAHKWIDFSEYGYGVSLLNDCKYGFRVKDGIMELAMLKSAVYPNPEADKEEHDFVYSIYPHKGTFKEARTVEYAYNLNTPLLSAVRGQQQGTLSSSLETVSVDTDNIQIEVIKKAENGDGSIIRLYEFKNKRAEAVLTFCNSINEAEECDLLENRIKSLEVQENQVKFTVKPYEIKTIRIKK